MTVELYLIQTKVPAPKPRKAKAKVPPALRKAAKEYKQAYKDVYHLSPSLTYDGKWVRIHGQEQGVSIRRLKELTAQLRNRIA